MATAVKYILPHLLKLYEFKLAEVFAFISGRFRRGLLILYAVCGSLAGLLDQVDGLAISFIQPGNGFRRHAS